MEKMFVNVDSLLNIDFLAQQKFPSILFPIKRNHIASLDVFCLAMAGKFDPFFCPRRSGVPAVPQRL